MLAEFLDAVENQEAAAIVARFHRGVPQMEAEPFEQRMNALIRSGRQHAGLYGVARVEHDADRHGLAMAQLVPRECLELVGRPMAVIERTAAAPFEGIAAMGDLAHVQLRATP